MASHRPIFKCECAWNKCTLRSWKEPRKCVCEQNNPSVDWVKTSDGKGQQKIGGLEE